MCTSPIVLFSFRQFHHTQSCQHFFFFLTTFFPPGNNVSRSLSLNCTHKILPEKGKRDKTEQVGQTWTSALCQHADEYMFKLKRDAVTPSCHLDSHSNYWSVITWTGSLSWVISVRSFFLMFFLCCSELILFPWR